MGDIMGILDFLFGASVQGQTGSRTRDYRVKERRGRPREDQGFTRDGRKDMRGRPREGETLYKRGTK
jgi:hypothetical protein